MLGKTVQFTATGTYSDGSSGDVTTSVNWSSSNEAMISIESLGVATPHATGGVTITATLEGVSSSTMLAVTPPASARLVWFTPDMASADMLDLFSDPEQWPDARASVQVFKFYPEQLHPLPYPCDICGPNTEPNLASAVAFSKLNQWGVDIGMEFGPVGDWACTAEASSSIAQTMIQAVQSDGGVVSYMAFDEPFTNGQGCNYTMTQIAAQTIKFIQLMHAFDPTLQMGDIEPYPGFTEPQLENWITTLEAGGITLPFFHLDVDRNAVAAVGADLPSDLKRIQTFCQSQGIALGVIFIAQQTSSAQELSDQDYYDYAMLWIQTVKGAIGVPQHSIFQSWVINGDGLWDVPINLPENDPAVYSHTRLINAGLAALAQ
jgi:Big-like domain-containing protein